MTTRDELARMIDRACWRLKRLILGRLLGVKSPTNWGGLGQ